MDVAQVKRSPTFYQAVHGADQSFFFSLDQVIHIFLFLFMMMQPYMVLPVDLKVTEQGLFNLLGLKTPSGRHLPGREIFGQKSRKK